MKKISTEKGFTLVEMLIAITIFSILVAIGVGGFAHALHTQREVASLISAQSNASIALEEMTREMRTGYLFCNNSANAGPNGTVCSPYCQLTGDPANPVWTCNGLIDFYNAQSQNVDYKLINGSLERSQTGDSGTYVPVVANTVNVTRLTFTIFGNSEGDNWTPRITIAMGIAPNSTDPAVAGDVLNLQTTVSAREIDCTTGPSPQC